LYFGRFSCVHMSGLPSNQTAPSAKPGGGKRRTDMRAASFGTDSKNTLRPCLPVTVLFKPQVEIIR
jgi:hypothetical protein